MQLQMEVCFLEECDFLETRFKEYGSFSEFVSDGTFTTTANGKPKGIIMCFQYDGEMQYEYSPWNADKAQYDLWESSVMAKRSESSWITNSYWYLDEVSCVLVLRNKLWFSAAKRGLEDVWLSITTERKNGFGHSRGANATAAASDKF